MTPEELSERIREDELVFSAVRSSGPGGQNVNKVNTKVELRINILASSSFSCEEKEILAIKLKNKINSLGELIVTAQSERTQLKNRQKALEKLLILISDALTESSERKQTAPTKNSRKKRLESKRIHGDLKKMRKDSGDLFDE